MGQNLVQYEVSMEQLVVQELETILKTDLPTILKERKQLDQLILELDTAKARLHTARQEDLNQGGPMTGAKVDRLMEELDDMARKVEQARDLLATDMMTFMAKDAELAKLIAKFLSFKLDYHSSIAEQVGDC
jgi:multidrug resistance efflux pump